MDAISEGLPLHWRDRLDATVTPAVQALGEAVHADIDATPLPVEPARWWTAAGVLQRLLTLLMVVGLVWLGVLFVAAWFQLPEVPTPDVGVIPLPTLLALGGGGLGLLLAALVAAGCRARCITSLRQRPGARSRPVWRRWPMTRSSRRLTQSSTHWRAWPR